MRRLNKTVAIYSFITVFLFLVGVVYHIFGRGVYSLAMNNVFVYPLFFGVFFTMILMRYEQKVSFANTTGYRIYFNLFGAGIALLSTHSFFTGMFEIAGTDSRFLPFFLYIGIVLLVVGFIIICLTISGRKRMQAAAMRRKARYK